MRLAPRSLLLFAAGALLLVAGSTSFSTAAFNSRHRTDDSVRAGSLRITTDKEGQSLVGAYELSFGPGRDAEDQIRITNVGDLPARVLATVEVTSESVPGLGAQIQYHAINLDTSAVCQYTAIPAFGTCDLGVLAPGASQQYQASLYWPTDNPPGPQYQGADLQLLLDWKGVS